jgi:hypothetical protein
MIALIDELHRATLEKKIIVGKCQLMSPAAPGAPTPVPIFCQRHNGAATTNQRAR